MSCVTSVRYSVCFNGVRLYSFQPTRGLRQGDPLSPYLFLFVADALSALLRKEVEDQTISPIKVTRNAPGVSHLLFADDSLLFFKADQSQAVQMKQVLENFCRGTGMLINPAKCSILFNKRCPENSQIHISSTLGTDQISFEPKYLALPMPDGRMKSDRFQAIQERVIYGWKRNIDKGCETGHSCIHHEHF